MTFCQFDAKCCVYDSHTECPGYSGTNIICNGCHDQSRRELNQLRYDYVDLSQLIPRGDARSEDQIFRPRPESSPPINVHVWHVRSEIAYQVMLTAMHLRGELGTGGHQQMPSREGWRLDHDIRYLGDHVADVAALPASERHWSTEAAELTERDGIAMLAAFGALHRRARKLCGTDPRTITVPGDCPRCLAPSLRRHADNSEVIWCVHCAQKMTGDEYHAVIRMQLPDCWRNP